MGTALADGRVAVASAWAIQEGDDGAEVWAGVQEPPQRPWRGLVSGQPWAVSFAGALVNHQELLDGLAQLPFQTGSAEEVLLSLMARSNQGTVVNRAVDALWQLRGVFQVALVSNDHLILVRDAMGVLPVFVGQLDGGVVASTERRVLLAAGARVVREMAPGEVVVVDSGGTHTLRPFARRPHAPCALAMLRDGAPADAPLGEPAFAVRRRVGEQLARVSAARATVVISLDEDDGLAVGFARVDGGQVTRMGPADEVLGVVVAGQRVVLVGAVLGGARLATLIERLLLAGAAEVHLRAVAMGARRCAYGVDAGPEGEPAWPGVSSVATMERGALRDALRWGNLRAEPCEGCLGGPWPVAPDAAEQLGLFR